MILFGLCGLLGYSHRTLTGPVPGLGKLVYILLFRQFHTATWWKVTAPAQGLGGMVYQAIFVPHEFPFQYILIGFWSRSSLEQLLNTARVFESFTQPLKVRSHLTSFSPFNDAPFKGSTFASTVSIVFIKNRQKNGQNGLNPFMLNKKRAVLILIKRAKRRYVWTRPNYRSLMSVLLNRMVYSSPTALALNNRTF